MIVENQLIEIKWHNNNKAHYINKGYEYTKNGMPFKAKAEDLLPSTIFEIEYICDYCGEKFVRKVSDNNKSHIIKKDACKKCTKLKRKESNILIHGVEWYTQSKDFEEKRSETMIERYGTIHALQNEESMNSFKNTCIENNGVPYPMMSEEVKTKRVETCLERYGVENTLGATEIREQIKQTCLEKYGVHTTALVPEVREKQRESLFENGTVKSSKPEKDTVKLLKEIYGEENCIPQYPTKYYNLDCLLTIGDILIDVEYDGIWCHKDKISFDKRRDKYHIGKGYKVFRIKANSKVPTKEQLIDAIKTLVESGDSYKEIIIENF
ncbi:MAG: DUF7487 domain-containing protein [Bacteroidales bacterium]